MNYDLAKKLKEAGLEQDGEQELYIFPDGRQQDYYTTDHEAVYVPTLSELIEACEDGFWSLERGVGNKWVALSKHMYGTPFFDSATEAVANLWLVLNNH